MFTLSSHSSSENSAVESYTRLSEGTSNQRWLSLGLGSSSFDVCTAIWYSNWPVVLSPDMQVDLNQNLEKKQSLSTWIKSSQNLKSNFWLLFGTRRLHVTFQRLWLNTKWEFVDFMQSFSHDGCLVRFFFSG